MSNAVIPLAKGYDPSKLSSTVYLSEKLDGVPVRIDVIVKGDSVAGLVVRSRQDKPVPSVAMQTKLLAQRVALTFSTGVYTFIAEVTHKTLTDFKDVSGVVRRHEQSNELILNIFDYASEQRPNQQFGDRYEKLFTKHNALVCEHVKIIPQHLVFGQEALNLLLEAMQRTYPNAEGFVARSHDAAFKPGTRHWDYQKIVVDPTVDLFIHGVEEAHSETGKPLGMAGRLLATYKGEPTGVGPGKLSHAERRELFLNAEEMLPRLACIKHKRDPSYTALRQPTFQHWRDDKDEVSYD